MEKIKVLFLDQREIIRYGICSLFKDDPRIEMVGQYNKISIWPELIGACQPDIVILDVGYTGTAITKEIKQRYEKQILVAITNESMDTEFLEIFQVGVKAYLQIEDLTAESLKAAIEISLTGRAVLTRPFSDILYKFLDPKDVHSYDPITMSGEEVEQSKKLSPQEKAVIALILAGSSNREISKYLHISENTAKVHLRNIKSKLGVNPKQKLDSFFQYHRHVRSRMLLEYYDLKEKITK